MKEKNSALKFLKKIKPYLLVGDSAIFINILIFILAPLLYFSGYTHISLFVISYLYVFLPF
ncbi:hypothetical protein KCQ_05556 [Pectobacterium atrosepticum ICMP 1526]|uniref:hypothetical protein n=1 Tax=Pectobacterium atrosepticum TaxID=29471 RepID=UPI00064EB3DD|nr:hypothetical protein [Pectobacterium atrosepticum]KMK87250.1 hypothetical protein KCQ_05556 [Pectobacterium atrosepticum ICMP 1526]